MKVGIVGCNGQVGTELALIYQKMDIEVVPIVRSSWSASFLKHHGFECKIGDINNSSEAKKLLKDLDNIIISVIISDFGGPSMYSSKLNQRIIKNIVKYSENNSNIINLSSIRAFGKNVDKNTPFWGIPYDREKKKSEILLKKYCKKYKKNGFNLRLGHVFGFNQSKTFDVKKILASEGPVFIDVKEDEVSNAVHTFTIAKTIVECISKKVKQNTYSVVNQPQWSWGEVFQFYNHNKRKIEFTRPKSKNLKKEKTFPLFLKYLINNAKWLVLLMRVNFLPPRFDQRFQSILRNGKAAKDLRDLLRKDRYYLEDFGYEEIPGPFINIRVSNDDKKEIESYLLSVYKN